jgi:hypothetical protein
MSNTPNRPVYSAGANFPPRKSRTPEKRSETTPQDHAFAESCGAAFRGATPGRAQLRFSKLAQTQVFCRCAERLWPATHQRGARWRPGNDSKSFGWHHPELVNARPTCIRIDAAQRHACHAIDPPGNCGGKIDVLRLLIERGADLNARNADGRLPLHDCFELNHDDFAKILLDAGAVPDVCAAAAYGMHDQLEQILESDPANANDLTTGNSPLGWAAFGHQPKSATILFQHGAVADRPPYDSCAWGPAADGRFHRCRTCPAGTRSEPELAG